MLQKIKSVLYGSIFLIVFSCIALYLANYILLQTKLNRIVKEDSRNKGLVIKLHYEHWFNYKRLVVDYQAVTPPAGRPAVIRSFFQIAHDMVETPFDQVVLEYRGTPRLMIDGDTFINLGERYGHEKPMNMLLHLVTNLRRPNGDRIFSGEKSRYASLLENNMQEDFTFEKNDPANQLFSSLTESR